MKDKLNITTKRTILLNRDFHTSEDDFKMDENHLYQKKKYISTRIEPELHNLTSVEIRFIDTSIVSILKNVVSSMKLQLEYNKINL